MSTKAMIEQTLNVSDMLMDKYLTDLDPQAFLTRPVGAMNHLAWQVGHLISTERRAIEAIKPGASPALPDGFDAQHAMDKHSDDNPEDFQTKEEYLSLWKAQRAATRSVLQELSDAELEAPCPNEKMRQMCPTIGSMFNVNGLHTVMHAGQFVAVRRKHEMPIAF